MFCSIHCRNSANGKKTGGWNKGPKVQLACARCGKAFEVHPCRANIAKHCSRVCHNRDNADESKRTGRIRGAANPMWRGGKWPYSYRLHLKDACEICSSTRHLNIHHVDGDWNNTAPDNLRTLCAKCHRELHGERDALSGRFVGRKPGSPVWKKPTY